MKLTTKRACLNKFRKLFKSDTLPMGRNIAKPFDARGFAGNVGIEALGNGRIHHHLFLFLQQVDKPLFEGDEFVDNGRF
jgi:hypothetical protein